MDKASTAKVKSNGLILHSRQVPLDNWKYCNCLLFVIIEALGEIYKSMIHEMKFGAYPNFFKQASKYLQCTLSKVPLHPEQ